MNFTVDITDDMADGPIVTVDLARVPQIGEEIFLLLDNQEKETEEDHTYKVLNVCTPIFSSIAPNGPFQRVDNIVVLVKEVD